MVMGDRGTALVDPFPAMTPVACDALRRVRVNLTAASPPVPQPAAAVMVTD